MDHYDNDCRLIVRMALSPVLRNIYAENYDLSSYHHETSDFPALIQNNSTNTLTVEQKQYLKTRHSAANAELMGSIISIFNCGITIYRKYPDSTHYAQEIQPEAANNMHIIHDSNHFNSTYQPGKYLDQNSEPRQLLPFEIQIIELRRHETEDHNPAPKFYSIAF